MRTAIIITLCAASFLAGTAIVGVGAQKTKTQCMTGDGSFVPCPAKPLTRRAAIRAVLSLADRCEKSGHLDLAGALEKAAGLALANNAERTKCGTDSECEGL